MGPKDCEVCTSRGFECVIEPGTTFPACKCDHQLFDRLCMACLNTRFDYSTNCTTCLIKSMDYSEKCRQCIIPTQNPKKFCSACINSSFDQQNSCKSCVDKEMDFNTGCTQCQPGFVLLYNECSTEGYLLGVGVFDMIFCHLAIILVVLLILMIKRRNQQNQDYEEIKKQ